jgi:glycosyltransferase involved in cell wall biosynthesis
MIGELEGRRVALAHDWLVAMRGGELVLDRLARLFGPTDLYTLVSNGRALTSAIDACRAVTSPLQRLPGARGRLRRHYLPLMPWAAGRIRVAPCDLLVSSHSAVIKAIRPPPGTPHLCYVHAPARYVWGDPAAYGPRRGNAGGRLRALGLGLVRGPLRRWDRATAAAVTRFLANSTHIAREVERCFGREAHVVHPPVRTGWFTPGPGTRREEWLLVAGALEPYKRVDLAIEAANRERLALKVAGTGSQGRALRGIAGPTVEMLGWVGEEDLRDLYRRARALVMPQVEDFGIAAVEAQACGCPVVALRAGGALDSITPATGVFFEEQSSPAIVDALRRLEHTTIDPAACRRNAERFGEERFDRQILRHARELMA